MTRRGSVVLLLGLLLGAGLPALAQLTDDELAKRDALEGFLRDAEVVEEEQMSESEGVTEPYKLTLEDGDMQRNALWKNPQGRVKGFWEGWNYEIAAYEMDKYLGLNMVPPTVERRFEGSKGSCQIWVEYWMTMRDKGAKKVTPPPDRVRHWNNMIYMQRAFDNLIANEDRHLGNILITEDWRMILIDHSRSFRSSKKHMKKLIFSPEGRGPEGPKVMKRLPGEFVDRIRALDAAKVREIVGEHLNDKEVEALLARKELILAEVDRLVKKNGEAKTLY